MPSYSTDMGRRRPSGCFLLSLALLAVLGYGVLWLTERAYSWLPENHWAQQIVHAPDPLAQSLEDWLYPPPTDPHGSAPPPPEIIQLSAEQIRLNSQGEAGQYTVSERVAQYGDQARATLAPWFDSAGLNYPPQRLVLVGLKQERILEVWAAPEPNAPLVFLRSYPILGASGGPGPKLREGDRQVPEGIYAIRSLNPNSSIHLSMRVDYPSAEDCAHAVEEERSNLGGDIMIHGGHGSIGCLAIGNSAIEELFVLVAETGVEHTTLILSPVDFRLRELPTTAPPVPAWMLARYWHIRRALLDLGSN